MAKYGFKISILEKPTIPENIATEDSLATYLAESLGLTSSRGKSLVAVKLLTLFSRIANKREDILKLREREAEIKNGAIKVEDLHAWLLEQDVDIGKAQLYNTYITNFLRAGLIIKKKGAMYGLRETSLYETLRNLERDISKEFEKIKEHAKIFENIIRKTQKTENTKVAREELKEPKEKNKEKENKTN